MLRRHLSATLFPYTTLFRSRRGRDTIGDLDVLVTGEACVDDDCREKLVQHLIRFPGLMEIIVHARFTGPAHPNRDRKSTRLNSSHVSISYAVFCLKKKKKKK